MIPVLTLQFVQKRGCVQTFPRLLDDVDKRERMGLAARQLVQDLYDLKSVSLPRMLSWVHKLATA